MSRFLRAILISAAATAAAYVTTAALRSKRPTPESRRRDGDGEESLTDEETEALVAELAQQV